MQGTGRHESNAARPLFGGALSAVIPHNASDISELREIPDNQEVFAHRHTDQSLIVDLLEYQSHVEDSEAARYHFEDLAGSYEASSAGASVVGSVDPLPKPQLSLQECSSAWLLTGTQHISKFNEEAKNTVNIHLGLFRLPQFSTDILVTFNDPVQINPQSSSAGVDGVITAPWTVQDFHQLLQTLRLLDPGVFG
ncbi:ran guanine nucleotide release factor [Megalops cyprinoides]|uniref:ran guanine nucleotide release factor n=1 Tax=Megalops cyprinoides TaxID=118141 RepID=UPI001863C336|nr:ran guanine nucleotide release factor [Megalops cyprinoides]